MSPAKVVLLSALALLANIVSAQRAEGPDSIICRGADGRVISRSVFTRQSQTQTEDRYRIDAEPGHIRIRTAYDSRGEASSETRYIFDGKIGAWVIDDRTDYSRDLGGRMVQKTAHDRNGIHLRTTYSYDANGRLLTEVLLRWNVDDNEWDPVKKYEYAYSYDRMPLDTREYVLRSHYHWANDADGWVRQPGRESWDYDMSGRATSRCTQEGSGDRDAQCTTYTYSPNGLLTEATTSRYESGGMVQVQRETYTYDSGNRVTTHNAYGRDGSLASEETYYYSKSHKKGKAASTARLDSTVVTSAAGEHTIRRIFAYNGKGQRTAICIQKQSLGAWTDTISVAYAFDATGGKRYENIVTYKAEGQPESHDISGVKENVLDENGQTVASYAYTADENGNLKLSDFTQHDNRYDTEGRLLTSVTIGEAGRIDSTVYAYDIVNRYEARVESEKTSCNLISRAWMRISGFFARTAESADTANVDVDRATSAAEKIVYTWDGSHWQPQEKSVATFDEYAKPHETEHFSYDTQTMAWTPVRKDVFETSNDLTKSRRGYVYNHQKSAYEISEREKFYYY